MGHCEKRLDNPGKFNYNTIARLGEGIAMLLDLRELIASPGKAQDFTFEPDPEELMFRGLLAYRSPVTVTGRVENHAGLLEARLVITADMLCQCARCLKEFPKQLRIEGAAYLTEELEDEDSEEYYLLEDGAADMGQIVRDLVFLNFDNRILCREDCKGLCDRCGKDLNDGPCDCGRDLDPRWLALGQLLESEK